VKLSEYVVRLEGRLSPPLTIDCTDFTENLPSFSVTVEKEMVKAEPHTNIQLEANEARERLQDEISPLLTVFGFIEGRAISLMVTDIIYPNFGTATRSIAARLVLREQPPTKDEVLLKAAWATADPIYRDLLDFYTEAQAAPNPRPIGLKMIERLEKKFGNRNNACSALGINDLKPIVAYQSKYQGDRHADYDLGDIPARLSQVERGEVLMLLKRIIDEYENRICAVLP
jgi:hypothetical protein